MNPKIVAIVGPTASGKSALAIEIAKKLNGEVISADSRQVYTGLNIGAGKVTKKEMSGVKHHMLDIVSPKRLYTADHYKNDAEKAIDKVLSKNKLPIVCGGSGFYIDALLYNKQFPGVPANEKLREKLSTYSTEELFSMLEKKDPERAKTIDRNNKVRLLRALEIVEKLGKVPSIDQKELSSASTRKYDCITIGIKISPTFLKKKIKSRLTARMNAGMIQEVKKLHEKGLSWKRMEILGLEYRYVSRYLRGQLSKEKMIEELNTEIWHYAKRQMTWFKRDTNIKWFEAKDKTKILAYCGR